MSVENGGENFDREYRTEPRQTGKTHMQNFMRDGKLALGMHVHTARADGNTYCEGGSSECSLFAVQLAEALEAWS